MTMRLQMIQKSPVIFYQYDPARVICPSELAFAIDGTLHRNDAVSWLWFSYARSVLADIEPCMEINEGAAATVSVASCHKGLSRMKVKGLPGNIYELRMGDSCLYLSETDAGDIFLDFFPPVKCFHHLGLFRIDLTDFSSTTSACFIAALFAAYARIAKYYEEHYLTRYRN